MKAKIIFIFTLILLVAIIFVGGAYAPYHLYSKIVSEGVSSDYLKIEKLSNNVLLPEVISMEVKDDLKNQSIWQIINFSNYQIPIAIGHPLINNIPIASHKHGNTEIGLDFTNSDNDSVFSFKIQSSTSFEPFSVSGKFFQLGVIKELIGQHSSKKIWEDLSSLDLRKMESSFIDFIMNIKQGYHDLVYRIYLLNLRSKYFEKEKKLYFY